VADLAASFPGLMNQRERRTLDHRIKAQIIASGDPTLFPELGIPYSTAMSWIRLGVNAVVTFDDHSPSMPPLMDQVAKLEHRVSVLTGVLRLVLALRCYCAGPNKNGASSSDPAGCHHMALGARLHATEFLSIVPIVG
jgi:hypothetical protein